MPATVNREGRGLQRDEQRRNKESRRETIREGRGLEHMQAEQRQKSALKLKW